MDLYESLRSKYPRFVYHGYHVEHTGGQYIISYTFEIEGLRTFHPTWTVPAGDVDPGADDTFRNMVFHLGMVELISYWKLTCSPRVDIACGHLCDEQLMWWKKLYFNGLGEFFYVNGITADVQDFMHITCLGKETFQAGGGKALAGTLIPIGGGKDSVVTLGVLKDRQADNYCYVINPRGATIRTAQVAGYASERVLAVHRTLDAGMLELNRKGFLNGHTPFSAIVAFSALLVCYIHGIQYIALSNESSANESTVADSSVNHQYSKSFEFEQDFHSYEAQYIKSGVYYFSLLRPLSEYQIAALFAQQRAFHPVFRSCNAGSKTDSWCGNCPKCLFVSIILAPFLSEAALVSIFGENLLDKAALLPVFQKLIGMVPEKPFECVGSRDEVNTALCEVVGRLDRLPSLLAYYVETPLYHTYKNKTNEYVNYFDTAHLLPVEFEVLLRTEMEHCINK